MLNKTTAIRIAVLLVALCAVPAVKAYYNIYATNGTFLGTTNDENPEYQGDIINWVGSPQDGNTDEDPNDENHDAN